MPDTLTPINVATCTSSDFVMRTECANGLIVCDVPLGALETLSSQWQELSSRVATPNVFHEPWFLLPAIKHFQQGNPAWQIMAVFRKAVGAKPEQLIGLFPMIRSRGILRCQQLSTWRHAYSFLSTPLIEKNCEEIVIAALDQHLTTAHKKLLWHFPVISADGPLRGALSERTRAGMQSSYFKTRYTRAVLNRSDDWEAEFDATISGHHKREYRRQRRKLEAMGDFEFRAMTKATTAPHWLQWFVDLEAKGWKAENGTAIQQNSEDLSFFKEIITHGAEREQVQMLGLFLNGEPIALKCNLISHPGSFAFKIAYDESLRKFSPGVLLEIENMRHFAEETDLEWMDSCAAPGHPMINRLWRDRRPIDDVIISSGHWSHELALGTLPLLRSVNRIRKQLFKRS